MMSDDDAPETTPETADADESRSASAEAERAAEARRRAVRLTTVYGGRVCQYGKAFPCVVSDVSAGGAKVRLKKPEDFNRIKQSGEVQLIFERLSDYKALNTVVAWKRPDEHILGLRFIDPELRRRVVIKRLMPNRWKIANQYDTDAPGEADASTAETSERNS